MQWQIHQGNHSETDTLRQRDKLISETITAAGSCLDGDGQTQSVWRDAEPLAESRRDAPALPMWEL